MAGISGRQRGTGTSGTCPGEDSVFPWDAYQRYTSLAIERAANSGACHPLATWLVSPPAGPETMPRPGQTGQGFRDGSVWRGQDGIGNSGIL